MYFGVYFGAQRGFVFCKGPRRSQNKASNLSFGGLEDKSSCGVEQGASAMTVEIEAPRDFQDIDKNVFLD